MFTGHPKEAFVYSGYRLHTLLGQIVGLWDNAAKG